MATSMLRLGDSPAGVALTRVRESAKYWVNVGATKRAQLALALRLTNRQHHRVSHRARTVAVCRGRRPAFPAGAIPGPARALPSNVILRPLRLFTRGWDTFAPAGCCTRRASRVARPWTKRDGFVNPRTCGTSAWGARSIRPYARRRPVSD